jgi:hypothetical protein
MMTEEKKDTTFGPITACYVALDKAIVGMHYADVPVYLDEWEDTTSWGLLDTARDAAAEAWKACDEPRHWVFSDGYDTFPHGPHKPSEMEDGSIFEAWLNNVPGLCWEWEDGGMYTVYMKGWYAMQDPTTGRADGTTRVAV